MKALESHSKLIQIQTRLSKQSYLSRGNLPGAPDAKMFIFLESIKRYPDRKSYPNFYHWYILMKQFATTSLEKWISNNAYLEEDPLIADFITLKSNEKVNADGGVNSFKKEKMNIAQGANKSDDHEKQKLARSEEFCPLSNSGNQIEYIIDVKIKEGNQSNMKQLVTNFLSQEQIQLKDLKVLTQQRRVRIMTKMQSQRYEELKNKISQLEGVQTFECKKKQKKFKTVNSLNNFLGESRGDKEILNN